MITITKSSSADSRSAKGPVSEVDLTNSTIMHKRDVESALNFLCEQINYRGIIHDNTKMYNMEEFCKALNSGKIKETDWYKMHITEERHHLKSNVPDDVNLIDVIEHLVDCTMAGLARSGEIYDIDLSPEVLQLAVSNTVELLKQNTEVIDNDHEEKNDILDEEI